MLRRPHFRRLCANVSASSTGGSAAAAAASDAAAAANANAAPEVALTAEQLTPRRVVGILDRYIIGQSEAKRAVAIALRNRWRRSAIADREMRQDVVPKNILMIGPTGVGKTEIARRLAKLTDAPFLKVEATKYTEVGFKGKDVDTIIEELYAVSRNKARQRLEREKDVEATRMAHDVIWNAVTRTATALSDLTLEQFLEKARDGSLNDTVVPVQTTVAPDPSAGGGGGGGASGGGAGGPMGFFGIPGVVMSTGDGGITFGAPRAQRQTLLRPVPEAIKLAKSEALLKLIDDSNVAALGKTICEEEGIVFIDEIDKVVADAAAMHADASSLGVQQDLLPLIEGSNVACKDGTQIATDTILFICSGAFHVVKPSDMIAELQGRLPVRVELKALTEAEFRRILTEPKFNLLRQQRALLATEGITLEIAESGVTEIARTATTINTNAQNIGARRLQTIIERVLEDVSFDVDAFIGKTTVIDREWVERSTKQLKTNVDLAKYLL
jgi:ATP-dependent HslUV protease ATP-binding subunit HslU